MNQAAWHSERVHLQAALAHGEKATQGQLDDLARRWQTRVGAAVREGGESLILVDDTGEAFEAGLSAPRWLCHTLALRHACAHVVLVWESPRLGPVFVCQVRSWSKRDFPGRIDISVGGHVVGNAGSRQTALIEMKEELGLRGPDLVGGALTRVGGYECFVTVEERQFYDVEWREVYLGHLHSLENLHFTDGEVAGVYLCPVAEARSLLTQQELAVANGLSLSLPLCLDHLSEPPAEGPSA
jgi:isopentenyldiphosphate isomerase